MMVRGGGTSGDHGPAFWITEKLLFIIVLRFGGTDTASLANSTGS
jgi:hypothetical protein